MGGKGGLAVEQNLPRTRRCHRAPRSREALALRGTRSLPKCQASIGVNAFGEQASQDYDSSTHACHLMDVVVLDARDRATKSKISKFDCSRPWYGEDGQLSSASHVVGYPYSEA